MQSLQGFEMATPSQVMRNEVKRNPHRELMFINVPSVNSLLWNINTDEPGNQS